MKRYLKSGEQFVVQSYVRHLKESCEFYRALGFEVVRDGTTL
jgi:catechol 2,3-dioxygenase-like lactoylglutathione lyase family enzyme